MMSHLHFYFSFFFFSLNQVTQTPVECENIVGILLDYGSGVRHRESLAAIVVLVANVPTAWQVPDVLGLPDGVRRLLSQKGERVKLQRLVHQGVAVAVEVDALMPQDLGDLDERADAELAMITVSARSMVVGFEVLVFRF